MACYLSPPLSKGTTITMPIDEASFFVAFDIKVGRAFHRILPSIIIPYVTLGGEDCLGLRSMAYRATTRMVAFQKIPHVLFFLECMILTQ